jgi:hypothetical protein
LINFAELGGIRIKLNTDKLRGSDRVCLFRSVENF